MIRKAMGVGALGLAILLVVAVGGAWADADEADEVVVLQNDSVEVALVTYPPGSGSELHVNTEGELGIVLEGELTLITPAGREVLKPGAVKWLAPLTPHEALNEGTIPAKIWALTLKQCK